MHMHEYNRFRVERGTDWFCFVLWLRKQIYVTVLLLYSTFDIHVHVFVVGELKSTLIFQPICFIYRPTCDKFERNELITAFVKTLHNHVVALFFFISVSENVLLTVKCLYLHSRYLFIFFVFVIYKYIDIPVN